MSATDPKDGNSLIIHVCIECTLGDSHYNSLTQAFQEYDHIRVSTTQCLGYCGREQRINVHDNEARHLYALKAYPSLNVMGHDGDPVRTILHRHGNDISPAD